jgi:hypothetical protein
MGVSQNLEMHVLAGQHGQPYLHLQGACAIMVSDKSTFKISTKF